MAKHGPKQMLRRWIALKRGDGIEKSRRVIRCLSLGAFVICAVVGAAAMFLGWQCLAVAIPSIVVGWLLAERNALESRIETWPIFDRYLNWEQVEKDSA